MTTNRRSRPLRRDPNEKVIGGVCSGLGHYFDVDTLLIRVGFVVVSLVGGGGVLAYLILWAALDPAPPGELETSADTRPPPIQNTGLAAAVEDTIDVQSHRADQEETPLDPPTPEARAADEEP